MENNYLPTIDFILHEEKDWEAKETLVVYPVDEYVTSECIHLYFLCIVTRCLFRDVFVMYLSHVIPRCSYREDI